MGVVKRVGLAAVATMAGAVAIGPSALPGHAAAAPATQLPLAAVAPAQADERSSTDSSSESDDGSAVNLLLAGGVATGVGVLLFATHHPRPLTKRRDWD